MNWRVYRPIKWQALILTLVAAGGCGLSSNKGIESAINCEREALGSKSPGAMESAISCYTSVLQTGTLKKREQSIAYLKRAVLNENMGAIDEAIGDVRMAVDLDTENIDAHFLYGVLSAKKGDYKSAVEAYSQVLSREPSKPFVHGFRGAAYYELADYSKAVADLTEAIRLTPGDHEALILRGRAYRKMGSLDAARADFIEALRHLQRQESEKTGGDSKKLWSAQEVEVYLHLAEVDEARGVIADALATYEEGIKTNPGSSELHNAMARFCLNPAHQNVCSTKRALTLALKANELSCFSNPNVLRTVAEAYRANRNLKSAIAAVKKALSIAPNDKELLRQLEIYEEMLRSQKSGSE